MVEGRKLDAAIEANLKGLGIWRMSGSYFDSREPAVPENPARNEDWQATRNFRPRPDEVREHGVSFYPRSIDMDQSG